MNAQPREPNRRISIWDPSPMRSDRFIVGHGNAVGLYQWMPKSAEIRMLASHPTQTLHDPSFLKCLAWSPHTTYNDLVATGSATGKIQLIRLNAGISSAPDSQNTLATPTILNLPSRMTRPCNTLAFSSHDPNYLAVGVDKSRGEPGLMIWDIETAAVSLPTSRMYPDNPLPSPRPQPKLPVRPLAPNENRSDPRIIYQGFSAEAVHSVAFIPNTSSQLLVGVAAKWLRLVDLRLGPNTGIQQILNKCAYGLCVDPFDETKFACFGDDGGIRIWDRRHFLNPPLLTFSEADAGSSGGKITTLSTLSFSPNKRGLMASLGTDDSCVRLWNIVGGHMISEDVSESSIDRHHHRRTGSTARTPVSERSMEKGDYLMPTLVHARRTKRLSRPLANFCFVTNPPAPRKTTHLLTVTKEGALDIAAAYDSPHHQWSARGELAIAQEDRIRVRPSCADSEMKNPPEPWDITIDSSAKFPNTPVTPKISARSEIQEDYRTGRSPSAQRQHDIEFPPLPLPSESSLTATRPSRQARTYSPASMRRFPLPTRKSASGTPFSDLNSGSPKASPRLRNKGLPDNGTGSPRSSPRPRTKGLPPASGVSTPPKKNERRSRSNTVKARQIYVEAEKMPLSGVEMTAAEDSRARTYMQDDMSVVIRRRVLKGYSMENAAHNAMIAIGDPIDGDVLSNVWKSLSRFMEVMRMGQSNKVVGFDFSFQGLLGIWEGFQPSYVSTGSSISDRLSKSFSSSLTDSPSLSSINLANLTNQGLSSSFGSKRQSTISHSTDSSATTTYASAISGETATQALEFDEAVELINERRMKARGGTVVLGQGYPNIIAKSTKVGRRRLALALCQWDLTTEEFVAEIKRWEEDGHTSRAACWSVLTNDYAQAIEYLIRSSDDSHRILSGTVSALVTQRAAEGPGSSGRPSPWRDHCERLIIGLDDPYLRILLSNLIDQSWSEILQDESIPLSDRLGITLRFLDDDQVSFSLRRTFENLKSSGDLEGLLFSGLTSSGMDVVQAYVDRTSDVQTAAILASYVSPGRFKDARVERWVNAYYELLDGWGLFHHRCQFDIERGQVLQHMVQGGDIQPFEWVERQLLIRCNYCNKVINSQHPMSEAFVPGSAQNMPSERVRTNCCPSCRKTLPRCVICLMTVGIAHDAARNTELTYETSLKDTLDDGMVFCQTCRHGGHASHIFDWFFGGVEPHKACPVADCDCRCPELSRYS